MQTGNPPRIHIRQFLEQQRGERYQAFVIHGPPYCGKTAFACQLTATTPGVIYLDVLKHVAACSELAQRIDLIDPHQLGRMAVTYAVQTKAQVLLVDEIDFLIYTWEEGLPAFQRMVEAISVTQTTAIIGFILHTQHALETWFLPNTVGQNRVLHIEDISASSLV